MEVVMNNEAKLVLDPDKNGAYKNKPNAAPISLDEIAGLLNWPEVLNTVDRANGFSELLRLVRLSKQLEDKQQQISACWSLLADKNYEQLLTYGYQNFKRTINLNYFTFLIQQADPQIRTLEALFSAYTRKYCKSIVEQMPSDPTFPAPDQKSYYYFVMLLWKCAKKIDKHGYLNQLQEPIEGNPLLVSTQGKSMSQDLANSLIEYYSMLEIVTFKDSKCVLEIGAGYGRNAYVILSLNPNIKMVIVDIMPALYIAQRYLSSVFSNRNIFKVQDFSTYAEVKEQMEAANIIFLLPQQLLLLPDKFFYLTINISSLGEMKIEQIKWYFKEINRLTAGYFYMKQWNVSKNPFDGLLLKKADYPYPANWQTIYSRDCLVQSEFFEAIYKVTNAHE